MEVEEGKDPLKMNIRPYNSASAQETEDDIKAQRIKPGRNLLRLEFIKKRKDFDQPVKFTETDSDKNVQFISFKDDVLGLRQKNVLEIGYISIYVDCKAPNPTPRQAPKPSSREKSTNACKSAKTNPNLKPSKSKMMIWLISSTMSILKWKPHCNLTRPSTSSRTTSMCCPTIMATKKQPNFLIPSKKLKICFT